MNQKQIMNLEDFTIYFLLITFALYVAFRYIKTETFENEDISSKKDWLYKWRMRRNILINDKENIIANASINDNSLRANQSGRLIDLYKLDDDSNSNALIPDIDNAQDEFWKEYREWQWRKMRNSLLERIDDLNAEIQAGQVTDATEEEKSAGRRAQQFFELYKLDADTTNDNNAPDIIMPHTENIEEAEEVDESSEIPTPFNNIYLNHYVNSIKGVGCKITPWGQEICKPDVKTVTLNDIDEKIKSLADAINNEERDIHITGSDNITINVNEDSSEIITDN